VKPPLLLSGLSDNEQRDLVAVARPRQLKPRDVLGHQGEPRICSRWCRSAT
jgi:hypothetical protein